MKCTRIACRFLASIALVVGFSTPAYPDSEDVLQQLFKGLRIDGTRGTGGLRIQIKTGSSTQSAPGRSSDQTQNQFIPNIQQAQSLLNRLGYDAGPADGLMGRSTRSAIRSFQRDNRLPETGRVDANLMRQLHDAVAVHDQERADPQVLTGSPTTASSDRTLARQVQTLLNALGYDAGPADGLPGSRTKTAVAAFQRDNDLPPTGEVSAILLQYLLSALTAQETERSSGQGSATRPIDQIIQQLVPGSRTGTRLSPGSVFRDCPVCPEMVVVPAGSFLMGDAPHEKHFFGVPTPVLLESLVIPAGVQVISPPDTAQFLAEPLVLPPGTFIANTSLADASGTPGQLVTRPGSLMVGPSGELWIFFASLVLPTGAFGTVPSGAMGAGLSFEELFELATQDTATGDGSTTGTTFVPDQVPARQVLIRRGSAVGRFEATYDEWDACYRDGACRHAPHASWGGGRGKLPVVDVNWSDAREYTRWLSARTGRNYRLLSETEWEYAARAESSTVFPWGDAIGGGNANCLDCGSGWGEKAAQVGSFPPNAFGLHDFHGNVWEWVADCWTEDETELPTDELAFQPTNQAYCRDRVVRGGSFLRGPEAVRSAYRRTIPGERRSLEIGFRVARSLE